MVDGEFSYVLIWCRVRCLAERDVVLGRELSDQVPAQHEQGSDSHKEHCDGDFRNGMPRQITQHGLVDDHLRIDQVLQSKVQTEPDADWNNQRRQDRYPTWKSFHVSDRLKFEIGGA